jgi:type VI secretion system protein ImpJ
MTVRHRVIWSQGMSLQPHHFQQEARFLEHLIDARVRAADTYAWGFSDQVIDEAQLALGRIALVRASGVMTDGTPFSMPDADTLAPLDVGADAHNEIVYLVAPLARFGATDVDFGDDDSADGVSRYAVVDEHVAHNPDLDVQTSPCCDESTEPCCPGSSVAS